MNRVPSVETKVVGKDMMRMKSYCIWKMNFMLLSKDKKRLFMSFRISFAEIVWDLVMRTNQ